MSSMIERVARAIYEEDDPWHKVWEWPNLNPDAQGGEYAANKYREVARAAIEAMMEPDGGMLEAGLRGLSDNGVDNPNIGDARYCFRAMLTAALADAPGEG